jgi:hypothetical protein
VRIPNAILCGFIIHFRTIICVVTVFLLYDTLMMVTRVTETCFKTYKCASITSLYIKTSMHSHWTSKGGPFAGCLTTINTTYSTERRVSCRRV